VDPQIAGIPAAAILRVMELKKPEKIDDQTIMMADIAAKARVQVASFIAEILFKHMPKDKATELAVALSEGRWTHDFPITVQLALQLGLPVTTKMPRIVYDLMDLYPQSTTQRPSVIYIPMRNDGKGEPAASPAKQGQAPVK
jgi:ClpP class serine protease